MARSIPAGTGTKGSASSPFPGPACWKPWPLRPRCGKSCGTGRCCKGNRLGWVLFEVGAEGATCWGKRGTEKHQWQVRALARLSAWQDWTQGWKGQPARGLGRDGQGMARDRLHCRARREHRAAPTSPKQLWRDPWLKSLHRVAGEISGFLSPGSTARPAPTECAACGWGG